MALASGSERFRVPKTSSEETGLVNDTVPPSTKYKNKWVVNIFAEWQSLREVKVPVLDCLFASMAVACYPFSPFKWFLMTFK